MEIKTSMKSVLGAAALTSGVAGLVAAAPSFPDTPRADIVNGTPYNDSLYGYNGGNDTYTGGRGTDSTYDPYGTNRYKFNLGDVQAPGPYGGCVPTDFTYGSGNDRADFYFPIKGRVFIQSYGKGGYGGLPTIFVYDYNGGRYELNGVKYVYEITPLGPRSVNFLEAPPVPPCPPSGYGGPPA